MADGSYYEVRVVPNAEGWSAKLVAQIDPVTRRLADDIRDRLREAVRDGLDGTNLPGSSTRVRQQGARIGSDYADAFEREIKSKMRRSLANLPEGKTRLLIDASPADRELGKIRAELLRLADANIGVDLEDTAALARIEELKARLLRLTGPEHDIRMRVNSKAALAELAAIKLAVNEVAEKGSLLSRIGGNIAGGASASPVGATAMVVAIVAALSTVGPLAAAGTAGVLGLGGAAGVAALAFRGLKAEVDKGSSIGTALKGDIDGIKGEIEKLASASAAVVGPVVHDLLGSIRSALPGFRPIIELVSDQLGNAASDLGATLLSVAQKASPLFADVAHYIEVGAQKLRTWVAGPSFDKFLDYARQQLPIIIGYVVDFGKALIDTFVALAPAGEATLKIFDLIAKGISASTSLIRANGLSVIGALLGTDDEKKKADASTGYIDGLIASMKNMGTTSTETAEKVKLAASTSTQAWLDASKGFDAATATTSSVAGILAAALTATRGDILGFTSTMAAADSATVNIAKTVHDNLKSITDSGTLLGVSYIDTSGKFVQASNQFTAGAGELLGAFQQQTPAATNAAAATYQHGVALGNTKGAARDALTVYKSYRQALIDQQVQGGATTAQAKALADQYFAIPEDVDTFVNMLGKDSVTLAISNLTDALNRLSDIIAVPKVALNSTDLDNSLRIKTSDLDYFGKLKTSPSLDLSTPAFDQGIAKSNGVLDVLGSKVATPTVGLNDQASGPLINLIGRLGAIDRDIYVTVHERTAQGLPAVQGRQVSNNYAGGFYNSVPAYAAGGITAKLQANVPHFAAGIEKHVPQIAMPGKFARVWAEPETQGEAYIPLANDWRRPGAEAILATVAERFAQESATSVSSLSAGHAAAAMGARGSGSGSGGLSGEVVVNVIDRDGSFVERMRGEIARTQGAQARAAVSGSASVVS